jgi:hypothetical protein
MTGGMRTSVRMVTNYLNWLAWPYLAMFALWHSSVPVLAVFGQTLPPSCQVLVTTPYLLRFPVFKASAKGQLSSLHARSCTIYISSTMGLIEAPGTLFINKVGPDCSAAPNCLTQPSSEFSDVPWLPSLTHVHS